MSQAQAHRRITRRLRRFSPIKTGFTIFFFFFVTASARAWYDRSAATRNPQGMAMFGECLLLGQGGPRNNVFGIMNLTEAAGLGSDFAAFLLGSGFFGGIWGLPKDPVRARYWIKKVVDRECEHKHLHSGDIAKAAEMLRALDEQANELEDY